MPIVPSYDCNMGGRRKSDQEDSCRTRIRPHQRKKKQEKIGDPEKSRKISRRNALERKPVCACKSQSREDRKKASAVGRRQQQAQEQCCPRNAPAKIDLPAAFLLRGHAQMKVIRRVI